MLNNWVSYCAIKKKDIYIYIKGRMDNEINQIYSDFEKKPNKIQNLKVSLLTNSIMLKDSVNMFASNLSISAFNAVGNRRTTGLLTSNFMPNGAQ